MPDSTTEVGARLRELRKAQKLSGRDVADRAGVSASYLSRLEHGHVSPTIATLSRIVQALGEPMVKVFEDGHSSLVVRRGERPVFHNRGVDDHLVTPRRAGALEVLESVIGPGDGNSGETYSHPGDEECIFVLEGEFNVWVNGVRHELGAGDSITFPCSAPHRWENPGSDPTRVLWIITPSFWYSPQPADET